MTGENTKLSPKNPGEFGAETEAESEVKNWPKKLEHRGRVLARIYKTAGHGYRLYWRSRNTGGRACSRMKDFRKYSEAKRVGDKLVSDLAKGSSLADLTPGQARDARAALERLQGFYEHTGERVSLLGAVSRYAEAAAKLGGRSLAEAVESYLSTVATIRRVDLLQAVEEFIEGRKPKTVAKEGKRPQLSPGYHYTVAMWLREFAKTFAGHAVCDLSKELLDTYMAGHGDVSPKTRNERRGTLRLFLKWAVRRDFLAPNHRLLEADGMAREIAEPGEIEFYTAKELRAMLERASKRPGSANS